jgi:hypothetical protein
MTQLYTEYSSIHYFVINVFQIIFTYIFQINFKLFRRMERKSYSIKLTIRSHPFFYFKNASYFVVKLVLKTE